MTKNLKKKIELSNLLEQVETNFDSKEIISKLDKLHSKSKAHVIGITGAPGVGKSSLINVIAGINEDSLLNVLDVILIVNMAIGILDVDLNGDMNNDGTINVIDIVSLVNLILS